MSLFSGAVLSTISCFLSRYAWKEFKEYIGIIRVNITPAIFEFSSIKKFQQFFLNRWISGTAYILHYRSQRFDIQRNGLYKFQLMQLATCSLIHFRTSHLLSHSSQFLFPVLYWSHCNQLAPLLPDYFYIYLFVTCSLTTSFCMTSHNLPASSLARYL